jgi:hypothetical protein
MLHICGVSKTFGEWYQKTNKIEDTNKLTLLAFKIVAIPHNTRLATFINFWKLSAKASLGIDRRTAVTRCWIAAAVLRSIPKATELNPISHLLALLGARP